MSARTLESEERTITKPHYTVVYKRYKGFSTREELTDHLITLKQNPDYFCYINLANEWYGVCIMPSRRWIIIERDCMYAEDKWSQRYTSTLPYNASDFVKQKAWKKVVAKEVTDLYGPAKMYLHNEEYTCLNPLILLGVSMVDSSFTKQEYNYIVNDYFSPYYMQSTSEAFAYRSSKGYVVSVNPFKDFVHLQDGTRFKKNFMAIQTRRFR